MGLIVFLSGALLLAPSACPGQESPAMEPAPPLEPVPSGLTVRQADIVGQVFLASEKPEEREKPAAKVRVQVRTMDAKEVLRETYTDKDGGYTLPKLDLGRYRLWIGSLKLILTVEGEQPAGELPKILIVVIPKPMTQSPP